MNIGTPSIIGLVIVLIAIGTLLDATKLLALEVINEEVHGVGTSQQS